MLFIKRIRKVLFGTKGEVKVETASTRTMLKFKSKHCVKRKETKIARARRLLTRDKLFKLYIIEGKTQKEIAVRYRIDTKALRTIFGSTGIQARRKGRPNKTSIALCTKRVNKVTKSEEEDNFIIEV